MGRPFGSHSEKSTIAMKRLWSNQDYRNHMSEVHRGTTSKEVIDNLVALAKSPKGRERMRLFRLGKSPWNKGLTKETDIRVAEYGRKSGLSNMGKKLTREHIRNSLKRRYMSGLEIRVNNVIEKYNLPYKFVGNGKFFIERKNPDFVNTNGEKIAVEVYARKHKELFRGNIKNWKQERQQIFAKYGWNIIFIEDWQTNKELDIFSLLKGGY